MDSITKEVDLLYQDSENDLSDDEKLVFLFMYDFQSSK